jgi:hypothetical protein
MIFTLPLIVHVWASATTLQTARKNVCPKGCAGIRRFGGQVAHPDCAQRGGVKSSPDISVQPHANDPKNGSWMRLPVP